MANNQKDSPVVLTVYTTPAIVVACGDETIKKVAEILDTQVTGDRIKSETEGVYQIKPAIKKKRYKTLNFQNKRDIKYRYINDFQNASEFYELFSKNGDAKIIYDPFSYERSKLLLELINLWESDMRITIAHSFPNVETLNASCKEYFSDIFENGSPYKTKHYDHRLACMDINTMLDFITYLTIDESKHKLNMNESDTKKIRDARNACSHYRVVTPKMYQETFDVINWFQTRRNMKSTLKTLSVIRSGLLKDAVSFMTKNYFS